MLEELTRTSDIFFFAIVLSYKLSFIAHESQGMLVDTGFIHLRSHYQLESFSTEEMIKVKG